MISAGLYHGGEVLSKLETTSLVDACSSPRWYEWLNTSILMYNVSRSLFIQSLFLTYDIYHEPLAHVSLSMRKKMAETYPWAG